MMYRYLNSFLFCTKNLPNYRYEIETAGRNERVVKTDFSICAFSHVHAGWNRQPGSGTSGVEGPNWSKEWLGVRAN